MKWAKYLPLLLLLVITWFVISNYHSDIPLETLNERYTYPDSRFISVDGMDIHYRRSGQGPDLLLIHGTGASLHTWNAWTEILQKDFRVTSVDLPAFGLTGPNPESDYSIPSYIDFLEEFRRAIQLDSFHLAGNSLGGLISWQYTLAHPEQVEKLILIDASGLPLKKSLPLAIRLAKNPLLGKILLKITPKSLFVKSLKEVYGDDTKITPAITARYFELFRRPGNRQAYVDRARQPFEADTTGIGRITAPTLILWGEQDTWIPVEHAYEFQRAIPRAELIIYPEAGHVPMEEIPERTAADARAFLLLGN